MEILFVVVIIVFTVAFFFRPKKNTLFLSRSETKKGITLINHYLKDFEYFQNLSVSGKSKFIKRVVEFINSKKFIGHHGLHVTGEMRVLIAASAVQLTFGLKKFILAHYHTIRLYPEAFYSRMLDAHLKGGTSEGGTISLSWADFKEGYSDPEDKYNLGLHEMAHALKLDLIKGYDFDQRFASYFDKWNDVASVTFQKMNTGSASFLREYGATNMHEFFAVCIEHFFEVPEQLKKELPDIYYNLAYLLYQDPLNKSGDYALNEKIVTEAKQTKVEVSERIERTTTKYDAWHWSLSLMMFGIFFGTAIIFVVRTVTVISLASIGGFILILAVVGMVQWPYFKKHVRLLNFPQFILYSIFGTGFCGTALILLLNFFISIDSVVEEHKIARYYKSFSGGDVFIEVVLYKNGYNNIPQIRRFDWNEAEEAGIFKSNMIRYYFSRGIFGFNVLEKFVFFNENEESIAAVTNNLNP